MPESRRKYREPTHHGGVPNPATLHSIPGHVLIHGVQDWSTSAETVARHLHRPITFVDPDGYTDEIVAGAVDAGRVAWLQCRSKDTGGYVDISFRLKAAVDDQDVVDWVPKTYNPFFGVNPLVFRWTDEGLTFAYSEKHHVYQAEFDRQGQCRLLRLLDDALVPEEEALRADERRRAIAQKASDEEQRRDRMFHVIVFLLFLAGVIVLYKLIS